jgi:uncharacterized protein (DUF2141 family)
MKRVKVQASMLVGMAFFLFVALALSRLNAQTSNAATLTVRVINARNAKGMIRVALFRMADGFPGDTSKAARVQDTRIDSTTLASEIVLVGIPPGFMRFLPFMTKT